MDLLTDNIWTLLLCTVILLLVWTMRRPPGLPPGPLLLPLIGNLLSMDADLRVTFRRLRKRYGDIFSVYIFNQPVIVLNGYDVIKDALVKNADIFSDRPPSFLSDHIFKKRGVALTSGSQWRDQRKFSVSALRELGLGKSVLEDKVKEEVSHLLETIASTNGEAFNCKYMVQCAVSNVICQMSFGKRYEHTDPVFQKLVTAVDDLVKIGTASVVNIFPAVRYLPGDLFSFWKTVRSREILETDCIHPIIEERMNSDDNDSNDFISAYVKEMKRMDQTEKKTSINEANLRMTVLQLFIAGTETTATTLRWALIYFFHNPEVQEKCFQEIKENIGLEKAPSMKDMVRLPYMEATIAEIQRYADIVPASVPHSVPYTVQYKGYTFPKGVTVLPMISSVLQDPDVWGDPQNFRPERFLDDEGIFQKREEVLAFSLGRRVCLGESLARMELFLFLSSMVQRFEFVCGDETKPSLTSIPGIVYIPPEFRMRAIPRCLKQD